MFPLTSSSINRINKPDNSKDAKIFSVSEAMKCKVVSSQVTRSSGTHYVPNIGLIIMARKKFNLFVDCIPNVQLSPKNKKQNLK